jgi:UDP-2,3-diacylglucosamine hydrolase
MTREKIFFISDVHLHETSLPMEEQKYKMLQSFFAAVQQEAHTLYIVGDYFDFWFDYRHVIPKQSLRGTHLLMNLREAGVDIHYLTGNHDHWAGSFFENDLKIAMHHEPLTITLGEKKIFLIHGDGVSDLDRRYRLVRKILRNRFNIFLFRWLHPDLGVALANTLSRLSKHQDREYKKYVGDQSTEKFFQSKFDQGADIIIMGHHHLPEERLFGEKKYINLGDWISHFTYAEWENSTVVLKKWDPL